MINGENLDTGSIVETLVNLFDTIYANDDEAIRFLGVGRDYFRSHYKPYCGVKQGQSKTYRKSELLARRNQLNHENEATS